MFHLTYHIASGSMVAHAQDSHQDLPVILHNDQRGLLTIEDGKFDVLQLSKDGRRESLNLDC